MKRIKTSVFVCLLAYLGFLMGCYVGPVPTFDRGAVEGMQPVYEEDLIIEKTGSRDLINPGKILSYGPILLVTERQQGIHVYDNSDPANPVNLFFLEVLDNNDVTIRNGLIYLDNGPDLVSLKVTIDTLVEVSRVRSLMNFDQLDLSEFPSENDVYYECPDPERGPVVFWRTTTLMDPKCYKRR
ncbi:MAG: hypothetical protein R8G66_14195 [Cytophagales bacterium]|nr:hypothetical protein [Cytophagales bacterium]